MFNVRIKWILDLHLSVVRKVTEDLCGKAVILFGKN